MVCVACLLPLFLIPIINLLPLLFDLIMGKVYGVFGWEYRKPVRRPPACPYKPAADKSGSKFYLGMPENKQQQQKYPKAQQQKKQQIKADEPIAADEQ